MHTLFFINLKYSHSSPFIYSATTVLAKGCCPHHCKNQIKSLCNFCIYYYTLYICILKTTFYNKQFILIKKLTTYSATTVWLERILWLQVQDGRAKSFINNLTENTIAARNKIFPVTNMVTTIAMPWKNVPLKISYTISTVSTQV